MTRLLPLLILLAFAGCKSTGSRDWYSGPAEVKPYTQDAINTALAELPRDTKTTLKWDWGSNRVNVKIVPATGKAYGQPTLRAPDGDQVYGYAIGNTVYLPVGFHSKTLLHEIGHVVMYANGNTDANWHHSLSFFKRN